MNNLTILNEYNRVYEQPLYTHPAVYQGEVDTKTIATHKAVVNESGEPISVVGFNYNLVQNADIMPQFHDVILASDLDKTGMTKRIDQSHRGAKTVVSYTFPAHRIEIAKGDFVDLKISVLNSYDGSWRFMSLVGAVRLACTNGQVIGDYFSSFYGKHTKSLDTDVAVKKLETALDVYAKNAELWKQYPSSKVTKPQAKKIFESMSGKNKKMLEFLEETHLQYIDEMGRNLWALFNTLTHWSSHAKFKNEANKSATIINRENKVRKVLPMLNDLLKVA